MAIQAPDGLAGIHLNFLRRPPPAEAAAVFAGAPVPEGLTDEESTALDLLRTQFKKGYILEQGQSPQSIGYSLNDSPAGLAAWILDHDADAHKKIARAFVEGKVSGGLTRDHVLDNITLYWLTETATSAARMYWESQRAAAAAAGQAPTRRGLGSRVGVTVFPGEISRAPAAGPSACTRTSSTSTRWRRAGISPPGRSPSCCRHRDLRSAFKSLR